MAENLEKKSEQLKPKKGFITAPTQDELKPSYDESYLLWKLIEDSKAAAKSQRVLGELRYAYSFH